MYVYAMVTRDEYELIEALADTQAELARMLGLKDYHANQAFYRKSKRYKGGKKMTTEKEKVTEATNTYLNLKSEFGKNQEKRNYYFTYASEGHPYYGGWSVVRAYNFKDACRVFETAHPSNEDGTLRCAGIYREEDFVNTDMYKHGNFGRYCWEAIELEVKVKCRF